MVDDLHRKKEYHGVFLVDSNLVKAGNFTGVASVMNNHSSISDAAEIYGASLGRLL